MLNDALAYPRRGEDVLQRHIIGGALLLFGFLLLPLVAVYGYLVRVVRGLVAGESEPPAWDDWETLLVDGVKYVVVTLVYGLPVAVLSGALSVAAAGVAIGLTTGEPGITLAAGVVLGLLGLVTGLLGLLAGYLAPAAVIHFVRADDVAAAFHLRTIARNAFTRPYFVAWLKTILVAIVLGFIGAILMVVLVGVLVFFYLTVVATYLLTEGYLDAVSQ